MGAYSQGLQRYPDKIRAAAKVLFEQGVGPTRIAERLGITNGVVVRRWFDDEYRTKYNERARLKRQDLAESPWAKGSFK